MKPETNLEKPEQTPYRKFSTEFDIAIHDETITYRYNVLAANERHAFSKMLCDSSINMLIMSEHGEALLDFEKSLDWKVEND